MHDESTLKRIERLERRLSTNEGVTKSLKDETGGLVQTVNGLLRAEQARTDALLGQHVSYAAAAQRAEASEARAMKLEAEVHRLEDKLSKLERRVSEQSS